MPHVIGTNWLNQNQFRDYPFIAHSQPRAVPPGLIVDFGASLPFVLRPVWLTSISRAGDTIEFRFACGGTDQQLVFSRDIADPEAVTTWAEAGETAGCDPHAEWFGFLTTGQMAAIEEILPTDGSLLFEDNDWLVEPSTVQRIDPGGVESINLANFDRTYTDGHPGCDLVEIPISNLLILGERCLTGDLEFAEGFNCLIRQSIEDSKLTFMAQTGEGAGVPCEEVPLNNEQLPISLSPYLSGGPRCEDLLRTINGVGGPHVRITGQKGVDVYQHPDNDHILVIDFTGRGAVNCLAALDAATSSSSSSSSISSSSSSSMSG